MNTLDSRLRALGVLLLLTVAQGCKVDFPNDLPYTCAADTDCGGDGYVCTPLPGDGPKYCCLPEEVELCNNVDDDCDGAVDELDTPCYDGPAGTSGVGECKSGDSMCAVNDSIVCLGQVVPRTEECNGLDDDCDGSADEDFDLATDLNNCGACGVKCNIQQNCVSGECVKRGELDCGNGVDDNNDGPADCLDRDDCDNQSCGTGCVCRDGRRAELNCGGGDDEDGDGLTDCADRLDCDGQSCGAGCVCLFGVRAETNCANGGDDDGDGATDCMDTDCDQQVCGTGKACRNAACVEGDCNNGEDDDGANGADCADIASCEGEDCGDGCICASGGRKEQDCADRLDNDGDGNVDCADQADCPQGTACTRTNGNAGTCQANKTCG